MTAGCRRRQPTICSERQISAIQRVNPCLPVWPQSNCGFILFKTRFYFDKALKKLRLNESNLRNRTIFLEAFESPMASPSDLATQEGAVRKQKKGAPFKFLVPLVYAPILPLIRISLRKNPVVRDRLFTAVLAGAFAHGFYLVTDLYDIESK
ncbi:uncharacterized protein LOC131157259 isoform X2 [Malania oleifera]|uniref:uncharacterized protein LOC131157259 isoform X2 n=1 Tax=Malania oleifera TaxID=397392 RepID=UPI0025AE7852|nr:uncharacterized protein LOC131157259 isoform X2 [Malania oleifera]